MAKEKTKRKCVKGKPCGAACISRDRVCRVDMPKESPSLSSTRSKVKSKISKKSASISIVNLLSKNLPDFNIERTRNGIELTQTIRGQKVKISLSEGRVFDFKINDSSTMKTNIPTETKRRLGDQLLMGMREMFKVMKEGTTFASYVRQSDPPSKASALARMGFGPQGSLGGPLVGIIKNGKLFPSNEIAFRADTSSLPL